MTLWIALSATASLFLLSVTNQVSQEVAVIPSDNKANIEIILGDARISLERELAEGGPQNFDVLVLDTFGSDSIPVHLVTKEAFALYLEHLAPDGIIAPHITNLPLDLQPVLWQLANHFDLHMVRVNYPGDSNGVRLALDFART